MCGNRIIEKLESPDKKISVVIFVRDCGATTGFSTQVSIIEASVGLSNNVGNILVMSDKPGDGLSFDGGGAKVEAEWVGQNALKIYFDKRTKIFKQKYEYKGIEISYEQFAAE